MTGASSSAIMRVACPAVPPSRRIVASSARRSPVDMAAVLISASAANITDSPMISHTPHAPSLLEECRVVRYCARVSDLMPGWASAYRASERAAAGPPATNTASSARVLAWRRATGASSTTSPSPAERS